MEPNPELEELVIGCLDRIAEEGDSAVDRACAEHAEHADALRRILGDLSRFGLVDLPAPERCVGDFRLLRRLGSGGMGEVWLAEQQSLRRRVALKLLRPGLLGQRRVRERFRREIDALSRLDHPHVCPVYEAGEIDDTPYLAMRFVDGESLAQRLERERVSRSTQPPSGRSREVRTTLALFAKLARALHAAHEHGLVHRDVKPANIMIDARGEPVVLDFGLAHELGTEHLTLSGDAIGTPAYMAPEQVAGRRDAIDRRTDVYALAATLYESLTLRPPFRSGSRESLYRMILTEPPHDPRRLNTAIGVELRAVLDRALDKDPRRRFATAVDFADELERIVRHEPVRTRRPGVLLRCYRWSQRNPTASAVIVLVSVGLAVALVLLRQNDIERTRLRAVALALAASDTVAENPELAFRLGREGLRTYVAEFGLGDDGGTDAAVIVEKLQQAMGELYTSAVLDRHGGAQVRRVTFSPDGRRIAVSTDERVHFLYDTADGRLLGALARNSRPNALAFSPNADSAELAAGEGPDVHRFDRDGRRIGTLARPDAAGDLVMCLTYTRAGDAILAGYNDGSACIWNLGDGSASWLGRDPSDSPVWVCGTSLDDAVLVTAGGDGDGQGGDPERYAICLWSRDGRPRARLVAHTNTVTSLAFGADGFVTASGDGTLRGWTLAGTPRFAAEFPGEALSHVEFDPRRERLAVASFRNWIRLFAPDGTLERSWRLSGGATSVRFAPDGNRLVTASWNMRVQVWNLRGTELLSLPGHLNGITDASFSPDGTRIASASYDGTARIWSVECSGARIRRDRAQRILAVAISPDGQRILSVGESGEAVLWNVRGTVIDRCELVHATPSSACFSAGDGTAVISYRSGDVLLWPPDGEPRVVSCGGWSWAPTFGAVLLAGGSRLVTSHGETLASWDLTAEDPAPRPFAAASWATDRILAMCASVDETLLLTGHAFGKSYLWDLHDERRSIELTGHDRDLSHVALSADGTMAVTCSQDGTARLWDCATGEPLALYRGHQGGVLWAGFSPTEARVLTASNDNTVRLWDRRTGSCLLVLRGHRAGVQAACFTPNGRQAISASHDGTLRWWWLRADDLLSAADALGIDSLTSAESRQFDRLLGK